MKLLYHGSSKKLNGERLIPRKAKDLDKREENMHNAVYATDNKDLAISRAIISSRGIYASYLTNKKPYGIIYRGKPEQEEVYLYYLDPKDFQQQMGNYLGQWISEKPVKPIKFEKLKVKDYLDLIRNATEEEKLRWIKKYGKFKN